MYSEYGEKHVVFETADRVFRFHVRFQDNDYFTASTETDDMLRTTRHLTENTQASLREIFQALGAMVATHPAILPAPLH